MGSHIYRIDNPGRMETFDTIGYSAVGTGEIHAISTFIANDYSFSLDLNHVVALTYEAKRRSEKAPGVGEKTNLVVVCKEGVRELPDAKIAALDKIYKARAQKEKDAVKEIE